MRYGIAALLSLALLTAPPVRAEAFTKEQIQGIIRDYLINHPEVMIEAMVAARDYQTGLGIEQNRQAVAAHHDRLFKDKASPSIGPGDAKVTLVEFFDYNCGACKIMFNALDAHLKENPALRVVFKEYPIFGETSEAPARIAIAVYRVAPERYFEFHKTLMKHQGRITEAVAEETLKALDLDAGKIKKEAGGRAVRRELEATRDLARALGASGTPMLVIGDEIIPHALDVDTLREKIAAAGK